MFLLDYGVWWEGKIGNKIKQKRIFGGLKAYIGLDLDASFIRRRRGTNLYANT
jgi:hypothetical protein